VSTLTWTLLFGGGYALLGWLLRGYRQEAADFRAMEERDARWDAELAALRELKGDCEEAVRLRRQADQDRRNCTVLSDALALSEGRRMVTGHGWEGARLREAVRATVAEVLGVDPSEMTS
jgi:hypothetical protein